MQRLSFAIARIGAISAGFLLLAGTAVSADFKLPEPPTYTKMNDDPLISLAHCKSQWLGKKIDAENSWINSLKRRKEIPDVDKEAIDGDIAKYKDDIKQDEADRTAISDKDAFDPKKNKDAKKNAQIVKANVQKWIETLNAEAKGSDAKEAKAAADNQANLDGALKDAEAEHPDLLK
jgi:hypothetical protein